MNKNWISLIIISGLTLALIFFWDSSPEDILGGLLSDQSQQSKRSSRADYPTVIVDNHHSQHFGDNGQLNHQFEADEVRHFQVKRKGPSQRDFTEASSPRLILFREDGPPWHITANNGRSQKNNSVITLTNNVVAWSIDPDTGARSELTTSKLVVKPDQHYAESDKPVKITTPESTTTATGMQAFLKQDKIKLLSQVRGLYESP
ncbi:MAG: LPS export ABC transporter periplasmic protein LptC [Candidatus Pelagadaptatus aseana]|uniref:LPS export ABC transporter periplasmic protein LptC n=1 Tax=Candidatus Pelagadaptatus aseana TaxID=3120508 RepID=UPI0039B175F9